MNFIPVIAEECDLTGETMLHPDSPDRFLLNRDLIAAISNDKIILLKGDQVLYASGKHYMNIRVDPEAKINLRDF